MLKSQGRENMFTVLHCSQKTVSGTHTVETHVVQGSAITLK